MTWLKCKKHENTGIQPHPGVFALDCFSVPSLNTRVKVLDRAIMYIAKIKKVLLAAVLLQLLALLPEILLAQDSPGPDAILSAMESAILELRELDAEGQVIKDQRIGLRREMDRFEAQGSALMAEKTDIDNRVAAYQEEATLFNSECGNVSQADSVTNNCRSRQLRLDDQAAELDEDAADLAPDVDDYNAEINAYNARDAEMAMEEEVIYSRTLPVINRIELLKAQFANFAGASGNQNLVLDVDKCNSLRGYEDTVFCLKRVWELVQ